MPHLLCPHHTCAHTAAKTCTLPNWYPLLFVPLQGPSPEGLSLVSVLLKAGELQTCEGGRGWW